MKTKTLGLWILLLSLTSMAWADTIVLHDGASYSGQFTGAREGSILFTDKQGVEYRMPIDDVQSLIFTATADIVSPARRQGVYGEIYGNGSNRVHRCEWNRLSIPDQGCRFARFQPDTTRSGGYKWRRHEGNSLRHGHCDFDE